MVDGFKIRKKSQCTICSECAEKLSVDKKLRRQSSQNGGVSELDSKNYATELCFVCEKSITRKSSRSLNNRAEHIATLLDKKFEDVGNRFGGVNPIIDTEYSREQIKEGVTKSESIKTQYDPVIVELRPDEIDIYKKVVEFLGKLSNISSIQYKTSEIKDENDEIALYEIMVFSVSS